MEQKYIRINSTYEDKLNILYSLTRIPVFDNGDSFIYVQPPTHIPVKIIKDNCDYTELTKEEYINQECITLKNYDVNTDILEKLFDSPNEPEFKDITKHITLSPTESNEYKLYSFLSAIGLDENIINEMDVTLKISESKIATVFFTAQENVYDYFRRKFTVEAKEYQKITDKEEYQLYLKLKQKYQ